MAQVSRLQQELDAVRRERDAYLAALKKLLPAERFSFDAAELAELEQKGCTLEQVLAEFKLLGIDA